MLYEEGFTQNREISWLRYDERVLEEALDETVPLFERLNFIKIFTTNLEEFFKVRVGSLLGEEDEGDDEIDMKSGMTAGEQLKQIHSLVPGLLMKKDMAFATVESGLAAKGIVRATAESLSDSEKQRCYEFFREKLMPGLRIILLSKNQRLPYLDEEMTYLIAKLDAEIEERYGLVDIPETLPKILVLDDGTNTCHPEHQPCHPERSTCHPERSEGSHTELDYDDDIPRVSTILRNSASYQNKAKSSARPVDAHDAPQADFRYIFSEDIIKMFADSLFVPFTPTEIHAIDIARTSEVGINEASANSVSEMKKILKKRKYASADKLITDGSLSDSLREYLKTSLGLADWQIFTTTKIDFEYLSELKDSLPEDRKQGLFYEPFIQYDQTQDMEGSVIEEIRKHDIVSFYPEDSMDAFLNMLREASFHPEVKEIRITIYRLASNPKITDYLINAASNGKKVKVVFELRARFDEEKNLNWAEKLKSAGCKVYYGTDKYKVHSKLCQVVMERPEKKDIKRTYITHISTGNYNENTAKQYTDISILTADKKIGKAASRVFKDVCKEEMGKRDYAPLLVSPVTMRSEITRLIRREAAKGERGLIFVKMNSLSDDELIEELMEASCKGCKVRMIVRGICCMLPGIENATENVCIVNLVGRFLEHSRVYIFGYGEDEVMYISSADFMTRNMDKRVELACPVRDKKIQARIREVMHKAYMDKVKGRVLTSDGTYARKM